MPQAVYDDAIARQKELGYPTFTAYIQALLRADSIQGGAHLRETSALPAMPAEREVVYPKGRKPSSSSVPKAGTSDKLAEIVKKHYPPPKGHQ